MIDAYNNEGRGRYRIYLTRGNEKQEIEVCADSSEEASELAQRIADDEDVLIWDEPDEELFVERIDALEYDEDDRTSYAFDHDQGTSA